MQAMLSVINSLPGVVGSLVCDGSGRLLGHAFPERFDLATLEEISRTLAGGATGLGLTAESLETLDLRFGEDRLVVKPVPGALLLVLCRRTVNLHFLSMSISVAASRLSEVPAAEAPAPPPGPATVGSTAADEGLAHGPGPRKAVPIPTKGLEELRRRLEARNRRR